MLVIVVLSLIISVSVVFFIAIAAFLSVAFGGGGERASGTADQTHIYHLDVSAETRGKTAREFQVSC